MSDQRRSGHAVAVDRRIVAGLLLVGAAAAAAAMLTGGAEARSAAVPSNVSPPTLSGTAVSGETLTASPGSWTGTPPISYAFAWERCDAAGGSCAPIAGETAETYVVASADIGSTLRVLVTASNAEGSASAESAATDVVTGPTVPVNTAEPVISGAAVEESTLSATTGTWTGTSITYAYQWVRCGADGGLPDGSNCPSIPGATSSAYTLTADDVGDRLRVQVTATNVAGSATATTNATDVVSSSTTKGPPVNTVEPSISGTVRQGSFLFATAGTWTGAPTITYAYQWVRCGEDGGAFDGSNCTFISGGTSSSYLLTSSDVGQRLRIRVTATNGDGVQTVASNATAVVQSPTTTTPTTPTTPTPVTPQAPRNTFAPSISGTATPGQTLFVSVGTWVGTSLTYTYQWLRCTADGGTPGGPTCPEIVGATTSQYAVIATDAGRRLRVRVTARNTLGTATATSEPTALVQTGSAQTQPTPDGLPSGAVRLPNGRYSIPVTSVSPPERLVVADVVFTPNPVRSRRTTLELRVRVVDTRGYAVRDALVFARATPLVTSAPGEQRTGRDGWVRLRMTPNAGFPLGDGRNVQFWVRVRKQGDEVLAGVSNRRLVQVATAG